MKKNVWCQIHKNFVDTLYFRGANVLGSMVSLCDEEMIPFQLVTTTNCKEIAFKNSNNCKYYTFLGEEKVSE